MPDPVADHRFGGVVPGVVEQRQQVRLGEGQGLARPGAAAELGQQGLRLTVEVALRERRPTCA